MRQGGTRWVDYTSINFLLLSAFLLRFSYERVIKPSMLSDINFALSPKPGTRVREEIEKRASASIDVIQRNLHMTFSCVHSNIFAAPPRAEFLSAFV